MPKFSPAETNLNFAIPAAGTYYLDIAQCLSYINRKFYRQGMEYVVQNLEAIGSTGDDTLVVVQRPIMGWVSSNAWVKGFSEWKDQQDEAMDEAGIRSLKGKYNDFKIAFDKDQDDSANLLPAAWQIPFGAVVTDPTVVYDWDYSQVVVPNDGGVAGNTVEYGLHYGGTDSATSRSLIYNYALARSRPHAFDPASVAPADESGLYGEMVDVGETMPDVTENVRASNNEPPYLMGNQSAHEWYPGGSEQPLGFAAVVDNLAIRAGTSAFSSDSTSSFSAYCGLLKITCTQAVTIIVRMAIGDYNGIMARPMQDVN